MNYKDRTNEFDFLVSHSFDLMEDYISTKKKQKDNMQPVVLYFFRKATNRIL